MKNLVIIISMVFAASANVFAQGSPEYTNAIYNEVYRWETLMKDRYKDTLILRRIESGILDNVSNVLSGSLVRNLTHGNRYIVYAFADKRIKDIKLTCYRQNTSTKAWEEVKSNNDRSNTANDETLIGDYELCSVDPADDNTYKFVITATATANTGRYGLMLWSKALEKAVEKTAKVKFFSIENRKVCTKDANGKYTNCTAKDDVSLFEFNAAETVLKHTTSDIKSSYFVSDKKRDDANAWYEYTLKSDVGNTYTMYLPDSKENVIFFKSDGDNSYFVVYKVRRSWEE